MLKHCVWGVGFYYVRTGRTKVNDEMLKCCVAAGCSYTHADGISLCQRQRSSVSVDQAGAKVQR